MTTLMDAISRVRSAFKLISADNIITNRVIADELRACATKLIKQQTDKRRLFSFSNIFTNLDCLRMEEVSLSTCCDYTSPCMIAKSVKRLPNIAANIYGPLVQGVYSIDGGVRFTYMDPDRYANQLRMYPKKKGNLSHFWIKDGYLYISNPNIEFVRISAYFEDYITPSDYSCSGPSTCPENPIHQEFKCPGHMVKDVVDMARDMVEKDYKRSIDDKTVNNNDESK